MSALTDTFKEIADAIRAKRETTDKYKPSEMAAAIKLILPKMKAITIKSKGTYDPADEGYEAYSKVTVDIDGMSFETDCYKRTDVIPIEFESEFDAKEIPTNFTASLEATS